MNVRVGTASWTDRTLIRDAERDAVWDDVLELVPDEHGERRSVYLSHLPDAGVDLAFERFADALLPLYSAGKLGGVFLQFPKWFTNRRDNRRYLDSLADRLPEYDVAVEFRHGSWFSGESGPKTLRQLERQGLAYVCVDEPQGFDSSMPPVVAATAGLAVMRFHGHNADLGGVGHLASRAVPVPVLARRAGAVGPTGHRAGVIGVGDPRHLQQLLPGLRRAQRRRPH